MEYRDKKKARRKTTKEVKHCSDKLTQALQEAMKDLTHMGKRKLEMEDLNKVINICKCSDKYVGEAFLLIMEYLEENHAEVRLSTFQICDNLFRRSRSFREKVVVNLEKVVRLTTGESLPPPVHVARELRTVALKIIHEWNSKFGHKHKKLALGYNYLRQVEKIDFDSLITTETGLQENQRHLEAVNGVRVKRISAEIKEMEADIKASATSLSNCINLLLPHPEDFFIVDDEDRGSDERQPLPQTSSAHESVSDSEDPNEELCNVGRREVGMVNTNYSIQLDFTPICSEANIEETPENTAIIENAREHARLISNKYLPIVNGWLQIFSKSPQPAYENERRSVMELKGELEDVMFKYSHIMFSSTADVSSDSDLEEVSEPLESRPSTSRQPVGSEPWNFLTQRNMKFKEPPDEELPSTSSQSKSRSSVSELQRVVTERKQKLLAVAPKLPFDIDLYHWEDEKISVPTLLPSSSDGHRFWMGSENCIEELPLPGGSASLRTRVIEFTGSFTPITHSCRVPLPSGKLCPRRDRYKCPFHGEIVPRDEKGECIDPKDKMKMQALAEKRQQAKPDWQDPKLLAEIKKSTGIDLKMPEKGKRNKRKSVYPGLTDLRQSENTVTKRLERKIFKKSVMKKVASALDKMDQRKFKDKFADQFHYFYNS